MIEDLLHLGGVPGHNDVGEQAQGIGHSPTARISSGCYGLAHHTPSKNAISKSLNQQPESTSTSTITGKCYRMSLHGK
jgi:hypothetical protein